MVTKSGIFVLWLTMTMTMTMTMVLAPGVRAQTNAAAESGSGMNFVDWRPTLSTSRTNSPSSIAVLIGFRGAVPLEDLLPQTTPDSRIRFLSLAGGLSFDGGLNSRIGKGIAAWKASLLDLTLQRAWWSGSMQVSTLESRTFFDFDRTWLELGTGPGIHVQRPGKAFSMRAQLFGGRRSARIPTGSVFVLEGTGWHGGIRFQSAARVGHSLVLTLSASRTAFSAGTLGLDEAGAGLDVILRQRWTVGGSFRFVPETGPVGAMHAAISQWQLGLTYRSRNAP